MKKAILTLFIWMLGASVTCFAETVDVNSAKNVAANFYSSNSDKAITNITVTFTETATDGSPDFYIFNINANDGFVIVTATDAAFPIMAYATTGHYDVNTVVPPVANWLKNRKQEISYIKVHNLTATEIIKEQWKALQTMQKKNKARVAGAVGPLCSTTWNQQLYYNALCPAGAVTGCTATAMAQIMKYWKYPVHGIGSNTYNDAISMGFWHDIGIVSADFGNTTYNWAAMPNNVTSANTAVATLMLHCGVSVTMNYGVDGSNGFVIPADSARNCTKYGGMVCSQTAFPKYFDYDSASIQGLEKKNFSNSEWIALLKNELNHARPVQYVGYEDDSRSSGHDWVCDGYDPFDMFHMNWGWSGNYNGYYSISSLDLIFYSFNAQDEALIGIQPRVITGMNDTDEENAVSIYPNPSKGLFTVYSLQFTGADIYVFNLLGEKVFEAHGQINHSSIDLSSQPAGVYVVRLQSGESVVNQKLVLE